MMFSKAFFVRRFPAWVRRCLLGLTFVACSAGAESAAAGGKLFLWEVKSATNSVYIFGSIHAATPDMYPLPQAVEDAYHRADRLVVEADVTDQAKTVESLSLLTYTPPDGLDKHVSPEVWKQLEATPLGKEAALKTFKPAALASFLAVAAIAAHGYDPQAGIDLHFLNSAHAEAKQVVELESVEFQAGILGAVSDEDGDLLLSETLKEMRSGELVRDVDQVAAAWKAGDDESVGRLLREANKDPASKKMYTKLFDERNPAMADKIAALASGTGHAFVVIGAGHLAGDRNVLELLKAKGLQVRQLP